MVCSYGHAESRLAMGQTAEALKHIQRARSTHPKEPRLAATEIRIRMTLGETERAEALLTRFLESHPQDYSIGEAEARLRLWQRDVRRARRRIRALSVTYPANPIPHQLLGELNILTGNHQAAARALHEAVALNPQATIPRRLLAVTLGKVAQFSEALHHWAVLCDNSNHRGQPCLELGEAHLQAGSPQRALGWADNAITSSPDDLDAVALRVRALIALGRIQEAMAMRSMLYRDPVTRLGHRLKVAEALARAELQGRTEAEYTAAIQEHPEEEQSWVEYGKWYFLTGQLNRAEAVLRQGLERLPKSSALHASLAGVFEKQERVKLAMLALKRSVELDKDRTDRADHLAFLEFTNGRQHDAISRWKALLSLGFVTDQVLERLALAYRLTGNLPWLCLLPRNW